MQTKDREERMAGPHRATTSAHPEGRTDSEVGSDQPLWGDGAGTPFETATEDTAQDDGTGSDQPLWGDGARTPFETATEDTAQDDGTGSDQPLWGDGARTPFETATEDTAQDDGTGSDQPLWGDGAGTPFETATEDTAQDDGTGSDQPLIFNGVDGDRGGYFLPPMTYAELAGLARRVPFRLARGPIEDVDIHDLASAGWGVVFPEAIDGAVCEALEPLLRLRKEQAGNRWRQLTFRKHDNKESFLRRHGAGAANPADPERVPYYLLLVGDPKAIPFELQYQLDVQYAVGRIHFEQPEHYASYAQTVVSAERAAASAPDPRRAEHQLTFFDVSNADDRSTALSHRALVTPLTENLQQRPYDWDVSRVDPQAASKSRLRSLLGGEETPDLLFTSSHGIGFRAGSARQRREQGGLVCSDWPGPETWKGPVARDHYLTAEDIPDDANLNGLIAFFFACFGAGTPHVDAFSHRVSGPPAEIAPEAFVARLPQRLLSHPGGGALAVVGHVDRAWGCSFLWGGAGSQPQAFEDSLRRLMKGYRIGAATEKLDERYAELAVDLTLELERERIRSLRPMAPRRPSPLRKVSNASAEIDLARRWTAHNDARSYVVLGDPAVRVRLPITS